jgi:mannose-6-phosphate isomerase-like protein (cupin superfamily)
MIEETEIKLAALLRVDEDIPYIEKPWGYERIFAQTDKYVGKFLFIAGGHRLSRQYHEEKDETITVLSGPLTLEVGPIGDDQTITSITLLVGEAFHIAPGLIHRFCAPEGVDVELIEVSTPQLDDIIRLEDDYKRIPDITA